MKKIDGEKVAERTSQCGKRLKVQVVAGLLAETLTNLSTKNGTIIEAKLKCGKNLWDSATQTIMTMFALHLLAKTHNSKEFQKIYDECQFDEKGQA